VRQKETDRRTYKEEKENKITEIERKRGRERRITLHFHTDCFLPSYLSSISCYFKIRI